MSTLPLLVVEHEAQCPPGWMGEWLLEAGAEIDVRRPYADDPLPPNLGEHSGLVVLGGEMGAYDDADHPWLSEVKRLSRVAVDDGTPVLGICLGLQLLAVALGGEVAPAPRGQQIGVLDVGWTAAAYDDRFGQPAMREALLRGEDPDSVVAPDASAVARWERAVAPFKLYR